MTLGEKLKMLRASRGLSQEQLAAELNVSASGNAATQRPTSTSCAPSAPILP